MRTLHVALIELRIVLLPQADLLLGELYLLAGGPLFQFQQALVAGLKIAPELDVSHRHRRQLDIYQNQLIGDALLAPGRVFNRHVDYLLPDRRRRFVGNVPGIGGLSSRPSKLCS